MLSGLDHTAQAAALTLTLPPSTPPADRTGNARPHRAFFGKGDGDDVRRSELPYRDTEGVLALVHLQRDWDLRPS